MMTGKKYTGQQWGDAAVFAPVVVCAAWPSDRIDRHGEPNRVAPLVYFQGPFDACHVGKINLT